jgi:hypothetical protein
MPPTDTQRPERKPSPQHESIESNQNAGPILSNPTLPDRMPSPVVTGRSPCAAPSAAAGTHPADRIHRYTPRR